MKFNTLRDFTSGYLGLEGELKLVYIRSHEVYILKLWSDDHDYDFFNAWGPYNEIQLKLLEIVKIVEIADILYSLSLINARKLPGTTADKNRLVFTIL